MAKSALRNPDWRSIHLDFLPFSAFAHIRTPSFSLFSSDCSLLPGWLSYINTVLLSSHFLFLKSSSSSPFSHLLVSFPLLPIHNATFILLTFSSFHFPFMPISIHPSRHFFVFIPHTFPAPHSVFHASTFPTFSSHSLFLSQGGILSSNHFHTPLIFSLC